MRRTLLVLLAVLLGAAPGHAANPLVEPLELTSEIEPLLRWDAAGRPYVAIDDMRIPVDTGLKSVSQYTTWTGGVVYYQFHSNVDHVDGRPLSGDGAGRRAAWRAAAMEWEATVPGLTFVEGTGSGDYILVKSDAGNWSYVGMVGWGAQEMGLYNWNYRFIIAHEIGHALGLMHEQSRSDRDTYVTVNYSNIEDDKEDNYDIAVGSTSYGPYDYSSSMHYGRCSFWDSGAGSCGPNGYTMDAKPAGAAAVGMSESEANSAMGQRSDLSAGDIAGVRSLYTPAGTVFESCFENGRPNAWSSVTGETVACAHDPCEAGVPLDSACDPCVAQINAADSYCRETWWDSLCVGQVSSVCGQPCS